MSSGTRHTLSRSKTSWTSVLSHDPTRALSQSSNAAIAFFASRDLLGEKVGLPKKLWDLPIPKAIVKRQQKDGAWLYSGGNKSLRSSENYDQLETFRNLGYLVEMYGFDKSNSVIQNAAEFLLTFQTDKGDIRGILGNQYSPYYTAAIAELLIKAGYTKDERIEGIFDWLESMRQDDGGWALPLRTRDRNLEVISAKGRPLEPDRLRPFSHLVTGMVLRAYAAHPVHRRSSEAKTAAELLLSRFFEKDPYPDRSTSTYWLRFSYPFWFTDLISAMDSLSKLGFTVEERHMAQGAQWFIDHQSPDGLWRLKALKNLKKFESELWLDLAICRVLKRLYS